jgi:hypothetical protein
MLNTKQKIKIVLAIAWTLYIIFGPTGLNVASKGYLIGLMWLIAGAAMWFRRDRG